MNHEPTLATGTTHDRMHPQAGTSLNHTSRSSRTALWRGAAVTAMAALFFPKIEAIKNNGNPLWEVATFVWPTDREGMILNPLVVALTIVLFALVGGWAWRRSDTVNRPATVAVVCGVLGLIGVLAFWLSAPIIFGGLAITLGWEGRRRSREQGKGRQAHAALVLGAVASAVGAAIWILA